MTYRRLIAMIVYKPCLGCSKCDSLFTEKITTMEAALENMIDLKSDLAAQCIRRLQVLFFMGSCPDGNTPYISQPLTCDKNDICNQLFIITELKICHLSIYQSLISSEISKNTNLHHVFEDKRQASPGDCKIYENYRTQELYCVSKLVRCRSWFSY